MAKIHNAEFSDFCCTGDKHTNGALVMRGNHVYSYNMNIAIVDRNEKHIRFFAKTVSRTTTTHQNAIRRAFELDLRHSGWTMETVA